MFILAAAYMIASDVPKQPCLRLGAQQIQKLTRRVRLADDRADRLEDLGLLSEYWTRTCMNERRGANRTIVKAVSSRVSIRDARFTVASMLVDVNRNLRFAEGDIRRALRDQSQLDTVTKKGAYPFQPSSNYAVRKSLLCVYKKLKTGEEDDRLCRFIRQAR